MTNLFRFAYFLQTALTQLYAYIDFCQALRDCLSSQPLCKHFYECITCSLNSQNLHNLSIVIYGFFFPFEFFAASTSQEALRNDVDSHRISSPEWRTIRGLARTRRRARWVHGDLNRQDENGSGVELPGIRTRLRTTGTKIVLCAFAINFLRSEYFAHSIKSSYPSLIYLLFNLYKL